MTLPRDVSRWPAHWRGEYEERESIMHDSGVRDSAGMAERDVRRRAERDGTADGNRL